MTKEAAQYLSEAVSNPTSGAGDPVIPVATRLMRQQILQAPVEYQNNIFSWNGFLLKPMQLWLSFTYSLLISLSITLIWYTIFI